MHPDLKALHTAVEALLKAGRTVEKATRRYNGEPSTNLQDYNIGGVIFWTTPKGGALQRAHQRQRNAADRVGDLWDQLNLDHPSPPIS